MVKISHENKAMMLFFFFFKFSPSVFTEIIFHMTKIDWT